MSRLHQEADFRGHLRAPTQGIPVRDPETRDQLAEFRLPKSL